VKDPDNSDEFSSVYDRWKAKEPSDDFSGEPRVSPLTSGSDYSGFYSSFGVPAVDIRYAYDKVSLVSNTVCKQIVYGRKNEAEW